MPCIQLTLFGEEVDREEKKPEAPRRRWGRCDDLSGMQFGGWAVLGVAPLRKGNATYWLCRCRCGNERRIQGGALKNGLSTQCRQCSYKAKRIPVGGMRFGRWTVVDEGFVKDGVWRWTCRCDCGTEKNIASSSLRAGSTTGCGKCRWICDNPDARNAMWKQINETAKKREITVDIDAESTFALLESQNFLCALSGTDIAIARRPSEHGHGQSTASLDRIDSSKPYEPGNIQWVHKDVNRMKQHYPQERFIEICRMVANKHAPG